MVTAMITWAIIFVAAVIAEAATLQLVTVWFAAGAFAAFIAAALGVPPVTQGIIFTAVSVLLLCVTRPVLRKLQVRNIVPTNADAEVGRLGILTQDIDPVRDTGRVRIGGVNWRARTESEQPLTAGTAVRVVRIEGTTAYVVPDAR